MTDASPLPDCLALRIGLAARSLPDTTPGQLLRVLVAVLGEPLTEIKLNGLAVKDLKTGAEGSLSEINGVLLRQALAIGGGRDVDHGRTGNRTAPEGCPGRRWS